MSVIIPAHNAADTIGRALSSVYRQTYAGIVDVVVVDDGSTDGTGEAARKQFPQSTIIRLTEASGSPGLPRNEGAKHVRGAYLAFLDADDEWYPHKISTQMDVFERIPATGLVTAYPEAICGSPGRALLPEPECGEVLQATFRDWLLRSGPTWDGIYPSGWVLKRTVFDSVGPFLSAQSQDLDYVLRLTGRGYASHVLACRLYRYIVGSQNITSQPSRKEQGILRVMEYIRNADPVNGAPWARGLLSEAEYGSILYKTVLRFLPVCVAYGLWETANRLIAECRSHAADGRCRRRMAASGAAFRTLRCLLDNPTGAAVLQRALQFRSAARTRSGGRPEGAL